MLFQNAIRLLRDKRNYKIKKENLINQSQVYTWLIRMWRKNEYAYFRLKEQARLKVYDTFYCTIESLNLSDFIMNFIEDLTMLQFCWSLNLLLPKKK